MSTPRADRLITLVEAAISRLDEGDLEGAEQKIAQASRIDFLSGLVTVETAMIALIDLHNLLSVPVGDADRAQAN
jgi:hypothetical protein